MSKPNSIYWRTACLVALTCCVSPLLLVGIEMFPWIRLFGEGVIVGSVFMPTMLAAAWTAFGPGRLLLRLPLSLGWAALMGLSLDIPVSMVDGPRQFGYFTLMTSALWLVAQVPFWGVSLYFGLKLWHQGTASQPHDHRHRQFGIRQLMVFTAFIAVLLGIGRGLVQSVSETEFDSSELRFWAFLFACQIAMSLPLICATMLPRHVLAGIIVSLLLIAGVAAAQLPLANQLVGGFPGNQFSLFTAMNLTSIFWTILFAVVVRYSGYHFGVPMTPSLIPAAAATREPAMVVGGDS